jgi:murein DD-endopeptidase MepM/ murein hydrolase activator NlpD
LYADGPEQAGTGLKSIVVQLERQYREPLAVAERLLLPARAGSRVQINSDASAPSETVEPPGLSLFIPLSDLPAPEVTEETPPPAEPSPEGRGGPDVTATPRPPAPVPPPRTATPASAPLAGWQWPTRSRLITDAFGVRRGSGYHGGMDIADRWKAPVSAIGSGMVVFAGNEGSTYGLSVVIRHPNGWLSRYAHLSGVYPRRGDQVVRGQLIGQMGDSGYAFGTHLHLEIIANGSVIDPLTVLPR